MTTLKLAYGSKYKTCQLVGPDYSFDEMPIHGDIVFWTPRVREDFQEGYLFVSHYFQNAEPYDMTINFDGVVIENTHRGILYSLKVFNMESAPILIQIN
jgi:hypothetical protein